MWDDLFFTALGMDWDRTDIDSPLYHKDAFELFIRALDEKANAPIPKCAKDDFEKDPVTAARPRTKARIVDTFEPVWPFFPYTCIEIRGDSSLVANWINGTWACKTPFDTTTVKKIHHWFFHLYSAGLRPLRHWAGWAKISIVQNPL